LFATRHPSQYYTNQEKFRLLWGWRERERGGGGRLPVLSVARMRHCGENIHPQILSYVNVGRQGILVFY